MHKPKTVKENDVGVTISLRVTKYVEKQSCFFIAFPKKKLQNLKSHLENNGITSRVHENTRRTPHNRTNHASLRHVVTFIDYAEREGLSLPGRIPGYKSFRIKLLPTSTSKAELWKCYKDAAEDEGFEVMGYTKFVTTWNDFLPFIKIMQPSTDLCHTCQKNTEKISGKANVSEDEKMAAIAEHSDHLNKAKSERELYNAAVDESKTVLKENPAVSLLAPNSPCSLKGTVHYSFDYAQQIHFPCNPQQPSPIYFIFGVCCESLPRQINYLIDESVATGKGANATISFLHDFFQNHGAGETIAHLHADNCGGQNKNNYVLWYLCADYS